MISFISKSAKEKEQSYMPARLMIINISSIRFIEGANKNPGFPGMQFSLGDIGQLNSFAYFLVATLC